MPSVANHFLAGSTQHVGSECAAFATRVPAAGLQTILEEGWWYGMVTLAADGEFSFGLDELQDKVTVFGKCTPRLNIAQILLTGGRTAGHT